MSREAAKAATPTSAILSDCFGSVIRRLESGSYRDYEPVGDGVFELRLMFGPGCRVYFGEDSGQYRALAMWWR